MQKLTDKTLKKFKPPFYVCAIRSDMIGINENLEIKIGDVRCIIAIVDDSIIIQNNPDVKTMALSAFRISYKNEVKLCKP